MPNVGRMVKESMVQELVAQLGARPNFFVTTVNRLTASEADTFRQQLHGLQARLIVIKRRLGHRAIGPLNVSGLTELFDGSVGLILPGSDVLPTAKTLVEFIKAHADHLAVRGALIDGQVLDHRRVAELASLPSKPILLAQVVATIELPIADVIGTLERLIGDLAWVAEQAAAAKPAAEPTPTQPTSTIEAAPATPAATEPPTKPGEGTAS